MSPTARTLALLRREGFAVAIVERWLPRVNRRRDCFGWADVLAMHPQARRIVLIQTTTLAHLSGRIGKAKALAELAWWIQAGGEAEFHGWVQRNGRWSCKRVGLGVGDVDQVISTPPRTKRKPRLEAGSLFDALTI